MASNVPSVWMTPAATTTAQSISAIAIDGTVGANPLPAVYTSPIETLTINQGNIVTGPKEFVFVDVVREINEMLSNRDQKV